MIVEKSQADSRLGSVEYDFEEYKKAKRLESEEYTRKLESAQLLNERLQEQVNKLQSAITSCRMVTEAKEERVHHLEVYLTKLPTAEEHQEILHKLEVTHQKLMDTEQQLKNEKSRIEQLEARLGEARALIKRKEECEELLRTQLNGALQKIHQKEIHSSDLVNGRAIPESMEDLHFELERYRTAYNQAKKLLEAESRRAEAANARQKMEKLQFEEQIAREEATVTGLKATLSSSRAQIDQLKERINQLNEEQQDLLSSLLDLKVGLSRAVKAWKSSGGGRRVRLLTHLRKAVEEVTLLTNFLFSLAKKESLNLEELLFQPQEDPSLTLIDEADDSEEPTTDNEAMTEFSDLTKGSVENMDIFNSSSIKSLSSVFDNCDETALLTQISSVQNTLVKLQQLRQQLIDSYANHLGGKLDCNVQ
ncbi:unnamed protein product [Calicophoron daubneyi]|uniref:Uncharacterized protein n=1 Tax=Calicophoron daubneyi TaxID=300641 RepID=A0AAV2T2V2_CALDB